MRTNIDIDDKLLADAMKSFGVDAKKATVDEALRRASRQEERYRELVGIGREAELDAMREGRNLGPSK